MALFAGTNLVNVGQKLTQPISMAMVNEEINVMSITCRREAFPCEVRENSTKQSTIKIKAQEILTKKEYTLEGRDEIKVPIFDVANYRQGMILLSKESKNLSSLNGKWVQVQNPNGELSYAKVVSVSLGSTQAKLYDIYHTDWTPDRVFIGGIQVSLV